jgi:hypothetical protein
MFFRRRFAVQLDQPDSGCCGMAGAWGYEAAHYDVSQACGERALFPAVRNTAGTTLIVADGFSCRHQFEQGDTGRRALHIAEVLELARRCGPEGPAGPHPEQTRDRSDGGGPPTLVAAAVAGAGLVGVAAARRLRRR